jgi:hypothetical protein
MAQFQSVSGRARLQRLRKKLAIALDLGGAALQRCGKGFSLNPASAAEVMLTAFVGVFPLPLQSCRNCFIIAAASAAEQCVLQIAPLPRASTGGKPFSSVLLSPSVNEFS